ncbi:hypothetical protein GY45DRAFT_1426025 [Cubamyces sp. BRFM 1775]|nr:hypothetical protein GY45DRAFT_1426025 [Cubamyces sp. BRFM 1775]
MNLCASRKCLDIAGRATSHSSSLSRTWSSTLVIQHRCYAAAAAQKTKEKTAVASAAPPATSRKAGKAVTPQQAAKDDVAAENALENEIENLETMRRLTESNQLDMTSVPLELLDLHVPTWRSYKENASLADHLRAITQTLRNSVLNAQSLYRMAKVRSIPGVKPKSPWSWQLFSTQSTKPTAWLSPFRQAALEVYKQVNEAIAARDEKTVKALSVGDQQGIYVKLLRSQDPRYIHVWKFHGERTPCRVVSVRAQEAYYGPKPPRMGSRLAVQALVRFDTLQSVESYSKRTGARVNETEPKPVVEYLVFQKRMWSDTPWVIRDRLYEGLELKATLPSYL